MSSNSSTSDSTHSLSLSFQEKVARFVQHNKFALIIGGALLGLALLCVILYFVFFRASRMERFADQFCSCTEQIEGDYWNESNDGFGYHSQLIPCIAENFSAYGERFNKAEKRILLEEFQMAVVEKCPNRLNKVLRYDIQ